MQFSYIFLAAVAACGVAAQKNNTATATGKAPKNTDMSGMSSGMAAATGGAKMSAMMNGSTKASATSSGTPAKQSTAAAPGLLLSQSGGLITVAGLGAAFAVFM